MKNVKPGHLVPVTCLDAGHFGKYNRSPVLPEYYESDMNWKLHLLLKAELEKRGIKVLVTRPDKDKDLDLVTRGKMAEDADLFWSGHSNAAATEDPNWVTVYYQVDDNCGQMDEQSKEIAELLAKCVSKVMGVEYQCRAVKSSSDRDGNGYKDDYYGVLRGAHAVHTPGVLPEHGFHTNPEQARWLLDEGNLQRLAEAEAEAICQYFDWHQEEPEHWYRIRKSWDKPETQQGAYKDPEAAKAACPVGYSVYNWHGNCIYYNGGGEFVTDNREIFIRGVQDACGAKEDGIAGPETLSKTVTISAAFNSKHPVVVAVQMYLYNLGYEEVGTADGIAGPKFTAALAHFQQDHECTPSGIAEEWGKTWQKLLGMA